MIKCNNDDRGGQGLQTDKPDSESAYIEQGLQVSLIYCLFIYFYKKKHLFVRGGKGTEMWLVICLKRGIY